ncbi:TetR family transcriptional regulator [Photorhabdus laumondii subsp. laumondii]|uniref:Photorhabdus luminescens subsp. laumondii TTO1 complete genome segment 3/17 n=2 Tax=Photorhabdus laumondii subsp. laumondii TaxID=141679 RepID=Q7N8C6_PHOLL|nr:MULTISPECIES: TetR/AcrR family transcriptional regulator [Photorhabdus]RAW74893.1 TetR/AcrR family transcriptional regulator [Photorhabdus sp. S14-60]AXG41555.1 TetR/AcrR family transcriptional regulator [Photorhabdus laumondii subsp. laumondii]AXG46081.1 TetR/AcrR family transcriptional regulator [Photorhabdus laumondii subsp. laumondii]MCC8386321.1 TetR/AcrR family transcriptional regulator [Photorhabdus laumondii]MCC8387300.1 TetR/AcrR family transcriptional regulator [Photorhabdus laumo
MAMIDSKTKTHFTGTRKKTYTLLINAALALFEQRAIPSVSELAMHAGVSRATAYRYFPTQSDLIDAIVGASLGPILTWKPASEKTEERITELLDFAYPRMFQYEGALRAALLVSLQQWAQGCLSEGKQEKKLVRGHRKDILAMVVEPLKGHFPPDILENVIRSFSLIYGSEVFLVMKDIWQMDNAEIIEITKWMAKAIINQAHRDSEL